MSLASIAAIVFVSSDSAFVRSLKIMDVLRENGFANSVENNRKVQELLDNMTKSV